MDYFLLQYFHINLKAKSMNKQITSTGGRIIQTKTGLIHYGNTDKFADEYENITGINGRPAKDSDKLTYDFSAFFQPVVPTWNGNSRVVNFK